MTAQYYMPTRLVAGRGCLHSEGGLLKDLGSKALIVTGAASARDNGSFDDAVSALKSNGQDFAVFDEVTSNPEVESVIRGAARAREERCDFVIALGGGSPMDAGKAMALLAACPDAPGQDLFDRSYDRCLPIAAVPTTAGTGSEVTPYAILTDHGIRNKRNLGSPLIFPRLAFLDGAYMRGLGRTITAHTAVDALSHAVESMLTPRSNDITEALCRRALYLIMRCMDALREGRLTLEERDSLLLASSLAGMAIANTGTTAVHALGYPLTYYKGVDHGRANGLLLGAFLAFVEKERPERSAAVLEAMGLASTEAFSDLLHGLLPAPEPLSDEEARQYARDVSVAKNIANSIARPDEAQLYAMLQGSRGIRIGF